jgi:hypothetical protein
VILRASINYVHQRKSLTEAVRVLRPRGWLFCRVECIWWDFYALRHPGRLFHFIFHLRNLGWGMLHHLFGVQPMPGGIIRGYRVFASKSRLRRILEPHGCQVLRYEESPHGPAILGRQTQMRVLCQRR